MFLVYQITTKNKETAYIKTRHILKPRHLILSSSKEGTVNFFIKIYNTGLYMFQCKPIYIFTLANFETLNPKKKNNFIFPG